MLAIGLMSGTSLDGIDAALIDTDGESVVRPIAFRSEPYSEAARAQLREAARIALQCEQPWPNPEIVAAADMVTRRHALAVHQLLASAGVKRADVAVIGFHGQTVAHRPDRGWTWQIGDGAQLAAAVGVPVVADFRSADVAAGGQGAPLLPVYHCALVAGMPKPMAILNIGGVANVTWIGAGIGKGGNASEAALIAFDTGPGNALVDDWMLAETGRPYDADGALAATGRIDESVLHQMLDNPWFNLPPPKSLDRADFTIQPARGLSPADGATTLTAFTAITIAFGFRHLPSPPGRLLVAGGGRHNATLMAMLADGCGMAIEPLDRLGHDGDATEAQGFAYMAVRSLHGLPISFPGTTGVARPLAGGTLHRPPATST